MSNRLLREKPSYSFTRLAMTVDHVVPSSHTFDRGSHLVIHYNIRERHAKFDDMVQVHVIATLICANRLPL